ncbi:MAG: BtpA/SgcQ family protein [Acetobacteraceae bacterium]
MSKSEGNPVAGTSGDAIRRIFGRGKVVIGVVHCLALPGAPAYEGAPMRAIIERALTDAEAYVTGGCDGLIVENHGDIPFLKPDEIGPETAACLAVIAERLGARFAVPLGVNVLANGARHALAVAKAAGCAFIRVNQWANAYVANEGFIEGRAGAALRYRAAIGARDVAVFADAHVKHGAHAIVADRPIAELARDVAFFQADAVIATGSRTGDPATDAELATIRGATHLPVLVGSGVTVESVEWILGRADGVIVASALKEGGVWWNPVAPERVRAFVAAARQRR